MQKAWIVGCGGIGLAIANLFASRNYDLTLFNRSPLHDSPLPVTSIDFSNEKQVGQLFSNDLEFPDIIIVSTGFLSDEQTRPEKTIQTFQFENFFKNLEGNLYPSLNLLKNLTQYMPRNHKLDFFSFSARVSSISDNRLGGWHSYRMSKTALNMLIKNVALEWSIKYPSANIYGYHPGTVQTNLSEKFLGNTAQKKIFSPTQAAEYFLKVFDSKDKESGFLYDWKGEQIPF